MTGTFHNVHILCIHTPSSDFTIITWFFLTHFAPEFARYLIFRLLLKSGETGTQWRRNPPRFRLPSHFAKNTDMPKPRYHPHHWKLRGVCLVAQVHVYVQYVLSFNLLFVFLCCVFKSFKVTEFLVVPQSHRWIERLWDVEFNPAMHDPNGLQCTVAMMWVIFVSNWVVTCDDYFRTSCASVSLIMFDMFADLCFQSRTSCQCCDMDSAEIQQKWISHTVSIYVRIYMYVYIYIIYYIYYILYIIYIIYVYTLIV